MMKKDKLFSKLKVAVIDDEELWIKKFLLMIEHIRDFDCVFTSPNVDFLLDNRHEMQSLDLLFLDINLKGELSLSYIPTLKQLFPELEIVMFTVFDDEEYLFKSLCLGANGYIVKSGSRLQIKNQIEAYRKGGAFLSANMALKLIEYFNPKEGFETLNYSLSTKELQILKLISEGWSYQKIASRIEISIDLLRYYVKKIYKKIQVNSKYEAKSFYDLHIRGK